MKYLNPTKQLTVNDWPYGRQLRTSAIFTIESNKHGERVNRITINPKNGIANKPKTTTYADLVRIVEGKDGKTYIAEYHKYNRICIRESNLQYEHESIYDSNPYFAELLALLQSS